MPFWGNYLSILSPCQVLFFTFKSPVLSYISFGVMNFMGSTDCAGDSRYSSISSSVSCTCGWNTSTRCFANTVAFSLSLFAHLS